MPVVIHDVEVIDEAPSPPPAAPTGTAPAPPTPGTTGPRLEQALRRLRERAQRVHAD